MLAEGDVIVAHNGIGFDYPAIRKLYPDWSPRGKLLDTMIMSRLIYTNLADADFNAGRKGYWNTSAGKVDFPEKFTQKKEGKTSTLYGSHSLKAWGWRLGDLKDDFDPNDYLLDTGEFRKVPSDIKPKEYKEFVKGRHTWKTIPWSIQMEDYCVQDVTVTKLLCDLLLSKDYSETAIELEHRFAWIIARQSRFGWKLDVPLAEKLQCELLARKAKLDDKLYEFFPPWYANKGLFTPKGNNKKTGYVKGASLCKVKLTLFNSGSEDIVANRLMTLYGWRPKEFTKSGKPKVTEDVLKQLDYDCIPTLIESMMINMRLGQVSEGSQAWLKQVKPDGRIYGYVNTNGAVTGRCTHSNPNVAQVPAGRAPYGKECRSCFIVDDGYKLVGADASGLELRCLGHYMAPYDGGDYAREVVDGDVHWKNLVAIGVANCLRDKGNDVHSKSRDKGKTWTYGFLYGCGDEKAGEAYAVTYQTFYGEKPEGKLSVLGRNSKRNIMSNLPALGTLISKVKAKAKKTKTLIGLDGRKLHVRSDHAALNTLLQSAGALIMKRALIELDDLLQAHGLTHSDQSENPDYEFVGNIHDEFQIQVKNEHAELVASLSAKAMTIAGDYFKFRCRIDGEADIGINWYETH